MGDIKFEKIKELDAPTIDILSKDPDKTYMFLAYDFERPAVKSTFHLFKFRFQIPYQEKWIIKIRHGYSFFLSDPNVLATNYDITSRAFADMIMRSIDPVNERLFDFKVKIQFDEADVIRNIRNSIAFRLN